MKPNQAVDELGFAGLQNLEMQLERALRESTTNVESEILSIMEELRTQTDKVALLMDFGKILNSSLDRDEVRQQAIVAATQLMNCEAATLYLLDKETNELYFETVVGSGNIDALKEIRLSIDEGSIAGSVALHEEPVLINDVSQDKRHYKKADEKSAFQTRNMVCVPVYAKSDLVGVLQALNHNENSFPADAVSWLTSLAAQVGNAVENAVLYEELRKAFVETVEALVSAIEAKDRYTGGHTKRVAYFSLLIAKYLNLTKRELEELHMSACLHDIGKIGVDDKVLKKNQQLQGEEWEHMKQHPEMGYRILAHISSLKRVTDGMRYHHERPDGKGYPEGLKGEEIPIIASIISVADTFDAMTSTRPYRKGLPYDVAFKEICAHRGTQFDEKVVDAFVEAFKNEGMGKKRFRQN